MHQQEAAVSQVHRLRQDQVFGGLGYGHHLRLAGFGGRLGHFVPAAGVDVQGVHPAVVAHDRGQGHGHVAAAGTDVGATPTPAEAEAVQGRLQGAAVHIVAEVQLGHWPNRSQMASRRHGQGDNLAPLVAVLRTLNALSGAQNGRAVLDSGRSPRIRGG